MDKKNQKGIKNPNYKHGKYIENRCSCGNLMAPLSKHCQDCYLNSIKGKNNPHHKDGRSLKKYLCINCKKEISIFSGYYGSGKCKSCSQKTGQKKYYCKCGTEISYNTVHYGKKHCSKCNGKFHSRRITGKNNPVWIDGRSYEGYPLEFNQKLKDQIRKRDNYICSCGMTEEEHLIVYGRVLDVHHIDYDKKNLKENNLISLCTGCNLRANWNRDYWIDYYQKVMENKPCLKNE